MAFEATTINGVTRQQNGNEYFYFFPLATFQAFDATLTADQYFFQVIREDVRKIDFDAVTDKLGTTNVVDYLDEAARQSLFFSLDTQETTLAALLASAQNQELTGLSEKAALMAIAELLVDIRFLLKSISE